MNANDEKQKDEVTKFTKMKNSNNLKDRRKLLSN